MGWIGGLTGRKIAALAETFDRPISPHSCAGPVVLTANVHPHDRRFKLAPRRNRAAYTTVPIAKWSRCCPDRERVIYPTVRPGLGTIKSNCCAIRRFHPCHEVRWRATRWIVCRACGSDRIGNRPRARRAFVTVARAEGTEMPDLERPASCPAWACDSRSYHRPAAVCPDLQLRGRRLSGQYLQCWTGWAWRGVLCNLKRTVPTIDCSSGSSRQ
jgi:hypothetical protein